MAQLTLADVSVRCGRYGKYHLHNSRKTQLYDVWLQLCEEWYTSTAQRGSFIARKEAHECMIQRNEYYEILM